MLAQRGERVIGCDSGNPGGAGRLAVLGVEVHLDTNALELLDRQSAPATIVKSPGVPREADVIAEAHRRGTPVVGELELAWRLVPNRFVAVTGTNGKTTTTELLGHLFRTAGEKVEVAGNVGRPVAALAGTADVGATVICEASSFQLEDSVDFSPECAVFLNLSPDHLDRHGNIEDYLGAKLRILVNQDGDDVAVINGDDPALLGELPGRARRVRFQGIGGTRGNYEIEVRGDVIQWRGEPLIGVDELRILGVHNRENAMAAAAAALSLGLDRDSVVEGLRTFEGVVHRMERVTERDGVLFINDSKATNVAATDVALRSFDGGVHLILGGSLKGEDFMLLLDQVSEKCRACYLIGESAGQIGLDLATSLESGVLLIRCEGLSDAVHRAAVSAVEGETVLLSPACASFDQFRDFEDRGDQFREIVAGL